MGLDLRTAGDQPGSLEASFRQLDEWAIQYLSEHSERILKKQLSPEQVAAGYTTSLKQKPGYNPLLRAKIDNSGRRAVCFWTPTGEQRQAPSDWKATLFRVNIHVSHLWIMGASYGLVINITDMEVAKEGVEPDAAPRESAFGK